MKKCTRNQSRGFTLIEIMIVVALIAILSAIAMPAYNNYVNRGKIKTAQADLVALSLKLENVYQRKLVYPTTAITTGTADVKQAYVGWAPATKDFVFSTSGGTGADYTITATGSAGGVNGCVITLKSNGDKAIAGTGCAYVGNGEWL